MPLHGHESVLPFALTALNRGNGFKSPQDLKGDFLEVARGLATRSVENGKPSRRIVEASSSSASAKSPPSL